MKFKFSISDALKSSWALFAAHPWFFLLLSVVMAVLNISARADHFIVVTILAALAALVWSYVWLSATLAAVDGKTDLLKVSALTKHFPTARQFFKLLCLGILSGIIIFCGLILLILPGIYFMIRLSFANLAFVDRQGSVKQSLRYSWHLVTGDVFWKVALVLLVVIAIVLVGALLFGIGLLISYPIALLLIAHFYRALSVHQQAQQEIVQQPTEIAPVSSEEIA
jgi:uncharacterized membrane protein